MPDTYNSPAHEKAVFDVQCIKDRLWDERVKLEAIPCQDMKGSEKDTLIRVVLLLDRIDEMLAARFT